jgi:hypothetical protein
MGAAQYCKKLRAPYLAWRTTMRDEYMDAHLRRSGFIKNDAGDMWVMTLIQQSQKYIDV